MKMQIIEHVATYIKSNYHLNCVSKYGDTPNSCFIDFYNANPANYRNREYAFTVINGSDSITVVNVHEQFEVVHARKSVTLRYDSPDFFESLDAAVLRLLATLRERYRVIDDVV